MIRYVFVVALALILASFPTLLSSESSILSQIERATVVLTESGLPNCTGTAFKNASGIAFIITASHCETGAREAAVVAMDNPVGEYVESVSTYEVRNYASQGEDVAVWLPVSEADNATLAAIALKLPKAIPMSTEPIEVVCMMGRIAPINGYMSKIVVPLKGYAMSPFPFPEDGMWTSVRPTGIEHWPGSSGSMCYQNWIPVGMLVGGLAGNILDIIRISAMPAFIEDAGGLKLAFDEMRTLDKLIEAPPELEPEPEPEPGPEPGQESQPEPGELPARAKFANWDELTTSERETWRAAWEENLWIGFRDWDGETTVVFELRREWIPVGTFTIKGIELEEAHELFGWMQEQDVSPYMLAGILVEP